jgi:flavin-binding protein dodecin
MDDLLKLAADAGHEISTAEDALDEGAHDAARDALDRAADHLANLRTRWPEMSAPERAVIGPSAKAIRGRLDSAAARIPTRRTLSEAPAEVDPEEETEPDAGSNGAPPPAA